MADKKLNPLDLLKELVFNTPELKETNWEAKECIKTMKDAEYPNWNQDEWVGFYFEFILQNHDYKGMTHFKWTPKGCNARFDWVIGEFPADLKADSIQENKKMSVISNVLLNDSKSMEQALKEKKRLYYIILFGTNKKELARELKDWKEQKLVGEQSNYVKSVLDKDGKIRVHKPLKTMYFPKRMILCEIDKDNKKYLADFVQGNQTNKWTAKESEEDIKRNLKYQFNKKYLHHFIIAELDLEPYQLEEKERRKNEK